MLRRSEWGARKPHYRENLFTPVDKIILNYYSRTRGCEENMDCMKMVRFIQDVHMDRKNYGDIAFNFLIGGNGVIYKGRGWTTNSERTKGKYKIYDGKCHEVCLLGDWREKEPPLIMLDAFRKLIAYGIRKKFVDPTYEIIERKEGILPPKTPDIDVAKHVPETTVVEQLAQ
ncbi:peptidoglycan-recognition protein LB-like isoform X3 [Macrosteles quadrilineatus]|nr:peptidoglycan-recognition protein LB-like isoform X3 [Macrosteles quadrilineatus]